MSRRESANSLNGFSYSGMNEKRALQIAMRTQPLEIIQKYLYNIVDIENKLHPGLALNYFRDNIQLVENPLLSSFFYNRDDVFDFLLIYMNDGIELIKYDGDSPQQSLLLAMAKIMIADHNDSFQKIAMFNKLINHEKTVDFKEGEKNILACLDIKVAGDSYNSYVKKFIENNLENLFLEHNDQKLTMLASLLLTDDLKDFLKAKVRSLADVIHKIFKLNEMATDLKIFKLIATILNYGYNITALDILVIQKIFSTLPDRKDLLQHALKEGAHGSGLEQTTAIISELLNSFDQHDLNNSRRRSVDSACSTCSQPFSDSDSQMTPDHKKLTKSISKTRLSDWKRRLSLFGARRKNRVHPFVACEKLEVTKKTTSITNSL